MITEKMVKTEEGWSTRLFLKVNSNPVLWRCDQYGNKSLIIEFDQPIFWWKRFWTKVFFGSVWSKVNDK